MAIYLDKKFKKKTINVAFIYPSQILFIYLIIKSLKNKHTTDYDAN